MVEDAYNPSYLGAEVGGLGFRAGSGPKCEILSEKHIKAKMA
jgi:hypothetical protein